MSPMVLLADAGKKFIKFVLYDCLQRRRNCKNEKTLTAICATFLLAAPIQMASAAANTTEGTQLQTVIKLFILINGQINGQIISG